MASNKFREIVNKVMKQNECAHHKEAEVCAPKEIVHKMKEYIAKSELNNKSNNQSNDRNNHNQGNDDQADDRSNHNQGNASQNNQNDRKINPASKNMTEKNIVEIMKEHLKCNTEICVLTSPKFLSFAKINDIARIIQENYKPQGPAETTEWLSNVEIDTILEQLVKKYSNRKCLHITYQTRDFQEIGSNMARLDFVEVFKKYNCFAVVFNTDYHTGSGIHWFCMFGELDTATGTITLEYFNSSGRPPLPEIQEWLIKTKNELIKADQWKKVEIVYVNNVEFQDDDHSCGVYTLSYIWLRLEGAKPKWFTKDLFNDALMLQMRKRLFRS